MNRGQYIPFSDEEQRSIFGPVVTIVGFSFPVSVNITMTEEQAKRLGRGERVCVLPDLPDSDRVYYQLYELPKDKVTISGDGWERIVDIPRANIGEVMDILYPDGLCESCWKIISAIEGDTIRLTGFGD